MQEISLSRAHYEAIQNQQGSDFAVEALRADIENHVGFPIELELRGPNGDHQTVASLSFVRAASRGTVTNTFHPNRLTCGFGADMEDSVANLFTALTHPHELVSAMKPVHLEEGEVEEAKVSGLMVGSFANPLAFIIVAP